MSSIPASAMPHVVIDRQEHRPPPVMRPLRLAFRIVTAPAVMTLGLTALMISGIAEVLAAKGSPVRIPANQVPI